MSFVSSTNLCAQNHNPTTTTTSATTTTTTTSATSNTSKKAFPSFYRRPLPETCVALSSKQGRQHFASAFASTPSGVKCFFPLIEQHTTQSEPAYCGISTLTMCLNAFAVDPRQNWKGYTPWRWYEESMLNCCIDLEEVKKTGITMKEFTCLARCQGVQAQVFYVQDETVCTLEHFRDQVRKACVEDDDDNNDNNNIDGQQEPNQKNDDHDILPLPHILVVSYNRSTLGQTGTGHFSPIGAYDAASDMVLILDTARFKYGSHWVHVPLLYQAMQAVDPESGKSRGYIVLTRETATSYTSSNDDVDSPLVFNLPMSILFRTKMNQYAARQEFKRFLERQRKEHPEEPPTWDEVLRYWTRDLDIIWSAVEPRIKPCSNEVSTMELIDQVRALIAELILQEEGEPRNKSNKESKCATTAAVGTIVPSPTEVVVEDPCCKPSCGPNAMRVLNLKAEEAIFVAYLASLEPELRRQVVYQIHHSTGTNNNHTIRNASDESPFTDEAREQLLAEAALIRYAIDMSDDHENK